MEVAKRKLLEQAHQTILKVGFEDNDYELIADLISTNFVAFGTALDEKIFGIKDLKVLLKRQKEQSKGFDMNVALSTLHTHLSKNENTAIYIDEGVLTIITGEESIEMILRLSMVLEYIEDKWLMVHFHSSKPEEVESEKDTWGIETWKERAEELEKEVAERTADLVLKNRDLEIEAALERVRARSMAMHSSDELNQVVAVLFENLKELQIPVTAAGIQIYLEDSEDMLNYVCGENSEGLVISHYRMPYFDNAIINDFKNARDSKKGFFVGNYSKKIKDSFYTYLFENTEIKNVPEDIKQMIFDSGAYTISIAPVSNSLIAINDFQGNQLSENHTVIIKRFAKVFEQAYIRFRDLQKAEAQAREAQIEAALEKVRSRSMAMHNSQELKEVALELRKQMGLLGQKDLEVCAIHLYGNDEDSFESWSAMKASGSETEIVQTQAHFPKRGIRIIDEMVHHYTIGTKDYVLVNEGEKIAEWFKVLKKHAPELHASILDSIGKVPVKQLKANWAVADFSGGALVMVTYGEPDEVSRNLLRRSANVFEQAYVRFLDLQKAEAQTREAQIQLALERVRAKTMAMKTQHDLLDVIEIFGIQLVSLGIRVDFSSFINGDITKNRDWDLWIYSPSVEYPPQRILIPFTETAYFTKTAKNIEEYERTGNPIQVKSFTKKEKADFLDHYNRFAPPTSNEIKEFSYSTPGSMIVDAFLGEVTVSIVKYELEPYSEDQLDIFRRFSNEFRQTYTRFLDLQKAEEQAREAQIEAALERVRAKAMSMQNSDELDEVLSVLCEQFDILGILPMSTHMTVFDFENNTFTFRETGKFGNRSFGEQTVELDAMDNWKETVDKWKIDKATAINKLHFPKEQLPKVWEVFRESFASMPEGSQITPEDYPNGIYHTAGKHPFGYIGMNQIRPATQEEEQIVIKFANEFGRAYQRFLDLQKAEAQTREAQIEAALEKVRSRSMGMQKSTELLEVISVVSQQLQTLGFRFSHVSFINNSLKEHNSFWVAATGLPNPMRFIIPYKAMPMIDNLRKAQKNKDAFYTNVSTIKEHQEWFKHLLKHSGENVFPKEIIDYQMSKGLARSISIHTNIMLALANTQSEPYSDYENKIIARFGQVFEQSYTRFLDLQRAEAQVKEAQIEAALERVRSRSMGMQKSEELEEIIQVVFDQFIQLGITVDHSGFIMDYKSRDDMHIWLADQHKITSQITLPYFDSPHWNSYNEAKKKGDNLFLNHLNFKEKNKFYKTIFKYVPDLPEDAKTFYLECPSLTIATTLADNIGLYIENYSGIQYSEDDQKTLIRFGKVFQQTYTRFLDLKKAEAQAREAQIEGALEKVRSRTMAMQASSELPLAANNLFLQVQELGIPAWSAGYCIWQDDKHNANCNMSSEGEIQKGFVLPSVGEGYDFYTPQENGERFYVEELGGEALVKHYEFMKQLPKMGEILKELINAGLELPTFQIFHIVYFKFGYVMFITYEEVPDAHDIFKRFGQVFEQTYTRFLDLERAEAQAREAKIEMALEKVRSRTMAMQKSDELQDAAQVLFNEIRGLGIPSWSCGYNILSDDKKSCVSWMSSEGQYQKPFTLIFEKEASFIEMYDFFKSDDALLIQELSDNAIKEHYAYMRSLPSLTSIFEDFDAMDIPFPEYQVNHLCKFNEGYLLFITYEQVPEAHDIFKRFTKVFEQTYTRFLDLKQAEARAREAQIQSALERVRSHSMGMQSTADFANVTTEMFNQLRSFGEDLFATGIVFCDKHEGHVEQWHSIPGAGMLSPMIVPIDLDYIHQYRYDQWKAGTTLFSIEIPSDFIEQHFEDIFKLPSAQVTIKDLESRNAPMPAPPAWEIDYGASFKHGYILVSSLKPIENMDILPRFAQVFEQAYIRFLDLQKAEAQARESQIEAALEKVRSRTLAMQKSNELADTSVVVFKELLALGIEPNRLFIGIVKDNGDAIDAWATNEDGSKIEQHFKLYTSKNKSIKKMVDGWKQQKKSTIIDMQGKELQEYFHYLNEVMHIPFIDGLKQKKRVQSIAYFSGGLIGMAAPAEQPEETINLLERFAAVFNLTYTRFNDLKIAEAQAKQAEEDLINLQKAKKNAEKALAELQNTQKQLVQSEKMASLGELTAGIAHEIQNPLNFVNNFSEVSKELLDEMLEEIENGDMDEVRAIMSDVIQNLEKINHHGKRADGIVKGMLQHSRASGDKKEATDINALADEYLRLAYHGLRAKDKSFNAQLETDFDESIDKVNIIPQDIGRVVLNLLTNAFYAVHEKAKANLENFEPTVSIRTKKTQDSVILEVKDNGNGMPDSVKEKIFQPFFTTKPTGQGTGLGLSLSYDIITKGHGGKMYVESSEGDGATIIINLPLNSIP